jgi:branched-chain amino acid transport system substrate-binding protein
MRARRVSAAIAIAATAALVVSACGGSSSSSGSSGSSGSAPSTIKLGELVDMTGVAASEATGVKGVQAYIDSVNAKGGINGAKIVTVVQDAGSTAAGALTGAQKLVETDHVFAILSLSTAFYGAEPYLLKNNVPVVGTGIDGPEWTDPTNTNLFSVIPQDFNKVYGTVGMIMKSQGVTDCGALGYSDNPNAHSAAIGGTKSCVAAGLEGSYTDFVKFGTTDVGPIALGIKNSGVDGMYYPVDPSTGFPVAATLAALGAHLKAELFPAGYGGDLLASPATVKVAQGFVFTTPIAPVEISTPATQVFKSNLAAVGVTSDPTYGQQTGYVSAVGFAEGLTAAGANPTPATFTTALRAVKGFDAEGLLTTPVDFSDISPDKNCWYALKLESDKFVPLQQTPFCGGVVGTVG